MPELHLSSCGATDDEARRNIRDAIEDSLRTSADMGTLKDVLEEAGYQLQGETWCAPEFVSLDRITLSIQ